MNKLKVNFKSQISALRDLVAITLVAITIIIVMIYYSFFPDYSFFIGIVYTSVILFLIFYLPVIILHINYLSNGEKSVDISSGEIVIKKKSIQESDIQSVDIYATNHYFRALTLISVAFLPYTLNYYYVCIKLKDGNVFFLNSLLGYKLGKILIENFPNVKINKNISIYPYI